MTQPLSSRNMLSVWEWGQNRHPLDRTLAILSMSLPDLDWEQVSQLPLGQRDIFLTTLYATTFSPRIQGTTQCSSCNQLLDFSLNISDIIPSDADRTKPTTGELKADGYHVHFRLPNTADLVATATSPDLDTGRQVLIQRCVIKATRDKKDESFEALPARIIARLAESMLALDPQAETLLDFNCPDCHGKWSSLLDISDFLWSAIRDSVTLLLDEIHTLANFYGWHEADILSMTPTRRKWYLRRVIT